MIIQTNCTSSTPYGVWTKNRGYTILYRLQNERLSAYHTFKPTNIQIHTQETSYLRRILGIPYDRLVGFASRNAVQVNEEDESTAEKMF